MRSAIFWTPKKSLAGARLFHYWTIAIQKCEFRLEHMVRYHIAIIKINISYPCLMRSEMSGCYRFKIQDKTLRVNPNA